MVQDLERRTRGQSQNDYWFSQRKGRITGSVAQSVLTSTRRLLSGELNFDKTPLIRRLLYSSVNPDLPALKNGREKESEAREKYINVMREFGHPKIKVHDCGLFVAHERIYLGASPDGLIDCPCCGEGVLEIKCPLSVSHSIPSPGNLDYIVQDPVSY